MLSSIESLKTKVCALADDPSQFAPVAGAVFQLQWEQNKAYRTWCESVGWDEKRVDAAASNPEFSPHDFPHLPVQAFKYADVLTSSLGADQVSEQPSVESLVFETSGTTSTRKGTSPGRHTVLDPSMYRWSLLEGFTRKYGPPTDWCILALLPDYLQRKRSSLVHMVVELHKASGHKEQGFFLDDTTDLTRRAQRALASGHRVMILGVTHALLDYASSRPDFSTASPDRLVVVETGGMKGLRKELVRDELHALLQNDLPQACIGSEYGMTEMLSQGWSTGARFQAPPWMRPSVRRSDDPFSRQKFGRTGGLNFVDLANLHSCAFLATQDLGRVYSDGSFEVLGRFEAGEVRGCNLLLLES